MVPKNASTTRRDLAFASAAVGLSPSLPERKVGFPGIIGRGDGSVLPLTALTPLILAIMVAWGLTSRRNHLTQNAVRRTGWLDASLILVLEVVVALITLVLPSGDWTVTRNVIVLVGLSVFGAAAVSPQVGAALVTVFVLFVVTYGAAAPGARFVRILQAPSTAPWPLTFAGLVTGAAILTLLLAPVSNGREDA